MPTELDLRPLCDIPSDGTCISIQEMLKLDNCKIPPNACFGFNTIIVDKHGHEVDGDWKQDNDGNWVSRGETCEHPDTAEYKAEHKLKKVVEPIVTEEISTSTQTLATVETPKLDPVVPEKKEAPPDVIITLIIGAVSGIVGPMITGFLKNMFKKPANQDSKPEEEQEEPTDCKTHQIKNNAKIISISKRLASLEARQPQKEEKNTMDLEIDELKDLAERIEKLEALVKNKH